MTRPATYSGGMYPLIGQPAYPELWRGCTGAWHPGLGPTGATLIDWSGYRGNGAFTNMDVGTDWVTTQKGLALDFDGTNDVVEVPDSTRNKPEKLTASIWMRRTTTGTGYGIFKQNTRTGNFEGYAIYGSGTIVGSTISNASGTQSILNATSAVNSWVHIAITFDRPTHSLYVDGGFVGSNTHDHALNYGTLPLAFGRSTGSLFYAPFTGQLTDMRIYDRALSPKEIRLLAVRPGIAYEIAPRRVSRIFTGGFKAYWAARKAQIIGGGL